MVILIPVLLSLFLCRLVVNDDSSKHAGHASVRGREGEETHFTIEVVSAVFEGLSLVKRHRMVRAGSICGSRLCYVRCNLT